jgi:RNA polymerase sigma-70 factor (ECF subfamily)
MTLFVQLLSANERRTYAYILSLVPNWADAEDIAQRVRMRLWEQFDRYDADKDFGVWARHIAYYLVLDYRKRSARRACQFSPEFLDTIAARVEKSVVEIDSRRAALSECLGKLPEARKRVLQRYYSRRESGQQIARDMHCSFAALRKSIQRIRNTLSRCVEQALRREAARG